MGVNVKFNRGFRRGEGGRVDGRWALIVARGGGAYCPFLDEPQRATITHLPRVIRPHPYEC